MTSILAQAQKALTRQKDSGLVNNVLGGVLFSFGSVESSFSVFYADGGSDIAIKPIQDGGGGGGEAWCSG